MQKNGLNGGYVVPGKAAVPMPTLYQKPNVDTVRTILAPGELVIPRRFVRTVETFLRSHGISFGNFK